MRNQQGLPVILLLLLTDTSARDTDIFNFDESLRLPVGGVPPQVQETRGSWEEVWQDRGAPLRLVCPVEGEGNTYYRWWKDGEEIDDLWSWYKLSSDNHRALRIKKLTDKTVGRYRCRGNNGFGPAEFTFQINFRGENSAGNGRLLVVGSLDNQTIPEGSALKLACQVASLERPPLQWLKSIERPREGQEAAKNILEVNNVYYKVLEEEGNTRHTITKGYRIEDGHYLHRLAILSALPEDSGTYMCLLFNPLNGGRAGESFQYQTASIRIIPHADQEMQLAAAASTRSGLMTALAILLPVVFVLVVVALVLTWRTKVCQTQHLKASKPPVSTTLNDSAKQQELLGKERIVGERNLNCDKFTWVYRDQG